MVIIIEYDGRIATYLMAFLFVFFGWKAAGVCLLMYFPSIWGEDYFEEEDIPLTEMLTYQFPRLRRTTEDIELFYQFECFIDDYIDSVEDMSVEQYFTCEMNL